MEKPFIHLCGLKLIEPATLFSDLLVAVFCFIFYKKLIRFQSQTLSIKYWRFFYLMLGVSTFIAGFAHVLLLYTRNGLLFISWFLSGFAIFFIELSSVSQISQQKSKQRLTQIIYLQLFLFIVALGYFKTFVSVKIHTAIGLIGFVLVINLSKYIVERKRGYFLIITGVLLIVFTAFIHSMRLSVNQWFNHNDLSHLVMTCSLFTFFEGVKGNERISGMTELTE